MLTVQEGEVNIGANASAEEQEEALEDGAQTVNDVIYSFRLQNTGFDKKSYMTYVKSYMKSVKKHLSETNPDRVAVFEEKVTPFVKKILGNFNVILHSLFEFILNRIMNFTLENP